MHGVRYLLWVCIERWGWSGKVPSRRNSQHVHEPKAQGVWTVQGAIMIALAAGKSHAGKVVSYRWERLKPGMACGGTPLGHLAGEPTSWIICVQVGHTFLQL